MQRLADTRERATAAPWARLGPDDERQDVVEAAPSPESRVVGSLHDLVGNHLLGHALLGESRDDLGCVVSHELHLAMSGFEGAGPMASNQLMARLMRRAEGVDVPAALRLMARSPGQPLADDVRQRMEQAFGHDFSAVRVHVGGAAAQAAEALRAHAFALGADVFFGAGEWAPGTRDGDRLLAHELTHVVQFDQGRLGASEGVSSPGDPLEREAYANEARIADALEAPVEVEAAAPSHAPTAAMRTPEEDRERAAAGPAMSSAASVRARLEEQIAMQPQPPDCINVHVGAQVLARIVPQGDPSDDDRFSVEVNEDTPGEITVDLMLDAPGRVEGMAHVTVDEIRVPVRVVRPGRPAPPRPSRPASTARPAEREDPPWWVFIPLAGLFWRPIREAAHRTATEDLPAAIDETATGVATTAREHSAELVAGITIPILCGFRIMLSPGSVFEAVQSKVECLEALAGARSNEERWRILITHAGSELASLIADRIRVPGFSGTPLAGSFGSWVAANRRAIMGRLLVNLFESGTQAAFEALSDGVADWGDWPAIGRNVTREMVEAVAEGIVEATGVGAPDGDEVGEMVQEITQQLLSDGIEAGGEAAADAVQRDGTGATPLTDVAVTKTARAGVSGGGSALPHRSRLQAAFGRHDLGGVRAHSGPRAAEASAAIGARAYATGDDVAFASTPSLSVAAHEAAHVVQQRAGARPAGGVGSAGDPYERQADEVAARVVRGESAEPVLDGIAAGPGGSAVQRDEDDLVDPWSSEAPGVADPWDTPGPVPGQDPDAAVVADVLVRAARGEDVPAHELDGAREKLDGFDTRATAIVLDRLQQEGLLDELVDRGVLTEADESELLGRVDAIIPVFLLICDPVSDAMVDDQVEWAEAAYARHGLRFTVVGRQRLDEETVRRILAMTGARDAADFNRQQEPAVPPGEEAEALLAEAWRREPRTGVSHAVFVPAMTDASVGGAAFNQGHYQTEHPGCLTTAGANPSTLAHEVGHLLGLPHIQDDPSEADAIPDDRESGHLMHAAPGRGFRLTPTQVEDIKRSLRARLVPQGPRPMAEPRVDIPPM